MSGYTKNVAVIKGLKDGFSADGGALSGLVRAEKYGSRLKVEISLINFAPMTEGRYVCAITDGVNSEIIENCLFEGDSEVDTSTGFASVVCYVHGSVSMIATAICGDFAGEAFALKDTIARAESVQPREELPSQIKQSSIKKEEPPEDGEVEEGYSPRYVVTDYQDEALAEVNYYEFPETHEGGEPVREDTQKETRGRKSRKNENASGTVKNQAQSIRLARGNFYSRMRAEIEGLLSSYPVEENLCAAIPESSWVKINYGEGKYYVFGIIRDNDKPAYVCYGVPAKESENPPESMRGLASYLAIPSDNCAGFWVMYQDASSGASVKVTAI